MSIALTRSMYLPPTNSQLFGLTHKQERQGRNTRRNLGWFNRQGHYLGQGDLNPEDLQKIAEALPLREVFATLTEEYFLEGGDTIPVALGAHCNLLVVHGRTVRRGESREKRGSFWEVTSEDMKAILTGPPETINDNRYFRA